MTVPFAGEKIEIGLEEFASVALLIAFGIGLFAWVL